jgi:hypothetical protein
MSVVMMPSFDMDSINSILKDDEMWPRVSANGQDKDSFYMMPVSGHLYVKAFYENNLCGFYHLSPLTESAFEIHANILADYRQYSKALSRGILDWCKNSLPAKTLVAHIPEHRKDVIGHTLSMGFKEVGIIPGAAMNNGVYVAVHVLARGNE